MRRTISGSEDDYENPDIGLGLALDIDGWRPREEDISKGEIVEKRRLEAAFRDLFEPRRKYYNRSKLVQVVRCLLSAWDVYLDDVLLENSKGAVGVVRFHYGVKHHHWRIGWQMTGTNDIVEILESRCQREIPTVIQFRTRIQVPPPKEEVDMLFLHDMSQGSMDLEDSCAAIET